MPREKKRKVRVSEWLILRESENAGCNRVTVIEQKKNLAFGQKQRQKLAEYFYTDGLVPFQWNEASESAWRP